MKIIKVLDCLKCPYHEKMNICLSWGIEPLHYCWKIKKYFQDITDLFKKCELEKGEENAT